MQDRCAYSEHSYHLDNTDMSQMPCLVSDIVLAQFSLPSLPGVGWGEEDLHWLDLVTQLPATSCLSYWLAHHDQPVSAPHSPLVSAFKVLIPSALPHSQEAAGMSLHCCPPPVPGVCDWTHRAT